MNNIEIIKSKRKTFSLEIKQDGRVICRAPDFARKEETDSFIISHKEWIERNLHQIKKSNNCQLPKFSADELKILKMKAENYIPDRVGFWAEKIGVNYNRIFFKFQKTRWGSCSSKGNLNFNCLLMLTDETLIDYVIVHELCHLKYMNHSKSFWESVASVMPDYKKYKASLRDAEKEVFPKVDFD